MKFTILALAFVGSALAVPAAFTSTPSSTPAASSSYAASSTPVASSTATPSATPSVKHFGWYEKAKRYGTYKNETSN
ncbi:hypothetical protein CFD26_107407 [Aspergillus turcosus]|uniref:Uncharacterized protein n=1 Tax=Aspergillus turcosus TaxID=1245748 RepID=A0A421D7J0_9EURO|nr:hypothetical protein CFD26_107407 [Aspergillus turcosus]